jgi:arylesterase / paraoxonase
MRKTMFGLGGGLILAAGLVGYSAWRLNIFQPLEPGPVIICEAVVGVAGPEDMEANASGDLVYVSSLDRQLQLKNRHTDDGEVRGVIMGFDMEDPLLSSNWRDRTGGLPLQFEPLGISLYEAGDYRRLFVINGHDNSVLLYDIADNGDLLLVERFTEPRLTSPNDIIAIGPREFYVSNDLAVGRNSLLGQAQFLVGWGGGEIYYFDGNSWGRAASGLKFANGLAITNESKRLIVAETAGKALSLYDRDPDNGILTLVRRVPLETFPDNFSWREDGSLIIGAHPKPFTLSAHIAIPLSQKAPSQIMALRFDDSGDIVGDPVLLYQNDGSELSAATVAVRINNRTIIGALMDNKFLLCD